MGLIIGNRSLQGSPMLPYPQAQAYANTDVFIDFAFVDHTLTPVVPTSIIVELDDITNSIVMNGPTTLVSTGSVAAPYIYTAFSSGNPTPWTLQISQSILNMSQPASTGSQIVMLKLVFTGVDSVTGQPFTLPKIIVIELISAPTVSGSL